MKEQDSKLELAIKDGDIDAIKNYLDSGGDPDIKLSGTPLIKAALEKGSFQIAGLLLKSGAELEKFFIPYEENIELVKWIVENNIPIDLANSLRTILGRPQYIEILTKHLSNEQLTACLAIGPSADMISEDGERLVFRMLHDKGALEKLCNIRLDDKGNTVIHNTNSINVIEKIIDLGLLPKTPVLNQYDMNAFEWQICQGKFQLADLLYKNGYRSNKTALELISRAIEYGMEQNTDRYKHYALLELLDERRGVLDRNKIISVAEGCTMLAETYLNGQNVNPNDLESMSKILLRIDEDWAKKILSYTEYTTSGPDIKVYRGIKGAINDDYMRNLFRFGFKSLGDRGNALFTMTTLGTRDKSYVAKMDDYEIRGPFTSLKIDQAALYAASYSTSLSSANASGYVLVAYIESDQKRVVGTLYYSSYNKNNEVIVNQLQPDSIKFIYKVDLNGKVIDRFENPKAKGGVDALPVSIGDELKTPKWTAKGEPKPEEKHAVRIKMQKSLNQIKEKGKS